MYHRGKQLIRTQINETVSLPTVFQFILNHFKTTLFLPFFSVNFACQQYKDLTTINDLTCHSKLH
jgi:hypothetical protein